MVAAVTATPTGGVHLTTIYDVACTGTNDNDATAYDVTKYPTEPQITYYFKFALAGQKDLKSPVFSTNAVGAAEWHDVLLGAIGSWTLTLNKTSDDSAAATATVVVS